MLFASLPLMVGGINITLANVIVAVVMFAMIVGVGITLGRHDRRSGGPERRASERAARMAADTGAAAPRRTPWDDGTAVTAPNPNAPAKKAAPAKPNAPAKQNVPAKSGNPKR